MIGVGLLEVLGDDEAVGDDGVGVGVIDGRKGVKVFATAGTFAGRWSTEGLDSSFDVRIFRPGGFEWQSFEVQRVSGCIVSRSIDGQEP